MIVRTDMRSFKKTMNNIIDYSVGFLEGAESGKKEFFNNLGRSVVYVLERYIDVEARANPEALHHVYEWYQTGSPSARLFNITYTVSGLGLSINSTFRQSRTVSKDGTEPFYNKARIMENGIPVTISPKPGGALKFEIAGNEVFTKKSVNVRNPGGPETVNGFEKVFDEFMTVYFTQSFLRSSGIFEYIKRPVVFKKNIKNGSRVGKAAGKNIGYKWIANAKIEVE